MCSRRIFYRVVGRQKADVQGDRDNDGGTSMISIMRDGNGEGEVMGCDCFQRERGGGDKAVPRRRRLTKAAAGVWRLKMTKEN
jgi:hypothetical protein